MNFRLFLLTLGLVSFLAVGCKNTKKEDQSDSMNATDTFLEESDSNSEKEVLYEADLETLNADVTGSETTGKARFVARGNTLSVTIDVKNAPANMEHWQHFHGFENGDQAKCPSDDQDENGDGIIDLMETEAVSGTTMVPFNDAPEGMEIPTDTYPVAGEDGDYHYEVDIDLEDLQDAFGDAFDGQDINLDKRVLFIHGVPADTDLPSSVKSLDPVPAQTTLPIACAVIKKVD